jgi:hypothetical protein
MEVVYNLGDGREIARSSQYSMKSTIEEDKNGDPVAILWSGKHKKNPNLTMTGALRFESSESSKGHPIGYYTETLYDQGRLNHVVVARCKSKEEKTPLPERGDPAPVCLKSGETPDPCDLQLGDAGSYGPPWPPSLSINIYTTETLQCLKPDGWIPEPCHLRGDSLYYHTPRKPQKRYVLNSHPELVSADWEAIAKHPNLNLFPPAHYDHPYKGARLNIVEVHTQEEVHSGCKVSYAPVPYILGCVTHDERDKTSSEYECTVYLHMDDIAKAGWTVNTILRHEIGHCNGWTGNHLGATHYPAGETSPVVDTPPDPGFLPGFVPL